METISLNREILVCPGDLKKRGKRRRESKTPTLPQKPRFDQKKLQIQFRNPLKYKIQNNPDS